MFSCYALLEYDTLLDKNKKIEKNQRNTPF